MWLPVLKAVVKIGPVGPLISGPGISHIRAVPSAALVAMVWLSPRNLTVVTGAGCGMLAATFRVAMSHIQTLLSALAAARLRLSGLNAIE
jgi:hypothetical protein